MEGARVASPIKVFADGSKSRSYISWIAWFSSTNSAIFIRSVTCLGRVSASISNGAIVVMPGAPVCIARHLIVLWSILSPKETQEVLVVRKHDRLRSPTAQLLNLNGGELPSEVI